jgi:Zn-dependent peptidase ImmA (M78 family)
MEEIASILTGSYKRIKFRPGDKFYWSPETKEVFYDKAASQQNGVWSLLHETGHALLEHVSYKADFELIRLEVAAWEKAKALASDMQIRIDEDHV